VNFGKQTNLPSTNMFPNLNHYLVLAEKIFFILGAVIYFIFSLVVVKQTTTMSKNVQDKFNAILIIFSYLHLAFSLLLVIITITIL